MSIRRDDEGRRYVQAEVEVPGTPEEVWRAIATGPGVSSWFVPTEKRADGTVVSRFGEGMEVVATETAYDPPRRFSGEAEMAPGGPRIATEWTVEALSGSTCFVRVVHSLFADTEDWDNHLENIERGWPDYFHILKLYLTHFSGLSSSVIQLIGFSAKPVEEVWESAAASLGVAGLSVGSPFAATADAPSLSGVVERTGEPGHPRQVMLRLDNPSPGLAHVFAADFGGKVFVSLRIFLYGDPGRDAAQREEPVWKHWIQQHFSAGGEPPAC